MITADQVVILARRHVADNPANEASARLCLADAVALLNQADYAAAQARAAQSLRYSVGCFHRAYKRAAVVYL